MSLRAMTPEERAVQATNAIIAAAYDSAAAEKIIAQVIVDAQEEILRPLLKLPELRDAHWIDVLVRRNGKDERYQADWLKEMRRHVRREVPAP